MVFAHKTYVLISRNDRHKRKDDCSESSRGASVDGSKALVSIGATFNREGEREVVVRTLTI